MELKNLVLLIEKDILARNFGISGTRFPSAEKLAERYGVSYVTARKAIQAMKGKFLLVSIGDKNFIALGQYAKTSDLYRIITKNKMKLGIHLKSLENPFFSSVTEKLNSHLIKSDIPLIINCSSNSPDEEKKALLRFVELGCHGVLNFIGIDERNLSTLYDTYPLPMVSIGRRIHNNTIPCVLSDNFQSGITAARHLLDYNYTEFVYVSHVTTHRLNEDERLNGFIFGLAQNGIKMSDDNILLIDLSDIITQNSIAAKIKKLSEKNRTGIFCYHDLIAGKIFQLCERNGISIPDNVGIVGYDDLQIILTNNLKLTTFSYNYDKIALATIQVILEKINTLSNQHTPVYIPTALLLRGTTKNTSTH